MSSAEVLDAVAPVVKQFEFLGVRYFIGGSVASSVYGAARTTLDADLVAELSAEHVTKLATALRDEFYLSETAIRQAIERKSCFNAIHLATMFKIDVFVTRTRDFDQSAFSRIRKDTIGDEHSQLEVFLASPEDVLLSKLEWFQLGDKVSERQWLDVIGMIKVQRGNLDRDYLRNWAANLGVVELLERAISEVVDRPGA